MSIQDREDYISNKTSIIPRSLKSSIKISGVMVGGSSPVRIMGILNTSPESFHKSSISTSNKQIRAAAKKISDDGADFIDIGGMSTAPYLKTTVSEHVEKSRVINAIKIAADSTNLPISVDTCRASVARAALKEGATILNDISGLQHDLKMSNVISDTRPSVILCASSLKQISGTMLDTILVLGKSLEIAKDSGASNIILDPAIGFFRKEGYGKLFTKITSYSNSTLRDLDMIKHLDMLKHGYPILISVSNKSFIGDILNRDSPDRLYGSIAAEAISVIFGADVIRTHNVLPTKDAIDVTSAINSRTLNY